MKVLLIPPSDSHSCDTGGKNLLETAAPSRMRNVCVEVACFHVYLHVFALCSLCFSPHFSLSDPASCYSFGHFSVFTCRCKNSSMYNNLQCLPPAPRLLEILGLSEFTVTAHLPQKHKYKKRTTVCVKNNFMTTFHHPQQPFGNGQCWPRARPQCPDVQYK